MKTLEIFSGAGGLAKGLELAGFDHEAFVEFNKDACLSLKENFQEEKVYFGDIRDYDFSTLRNIEIVAGGPPCQPFSLGGKHKANQDDRDMFPYAIKAISTLSPKSFVFENVKGLLRSTFSEYFDYIILRLTFPDLSPELGIDWKTHLQALRKTNYYSYSGKKYRVSYKLINAADYGVPQSRERVVIIGVRSDISELWVFPAATHSDERLLWEKYVTAEYWDRHQVPKKQREIPSAVLQDKIERLRDRFGMFAPDAQPWQTVRDALSGVPDPRHRHHLPDHLFRDGARVYPGHTGSDYDWPAKTIKAGGHGVPGGENMIRFPDDSVRYFTVFEAKRIQTFPDSFVIHGAWGEAMRQIGNAVPVALARKLGTALRLLLEKSRPSLSRPAFPDRNERITGLSQEPQARGY